jgi:ribosomal protein S18 acetylase RimI-like enzyme
MNSTMTITFTVSNDIPALKKILDATFLFPSDMLPEMLEPYLNRNHAKQHEPAGFEEIWLTCCQANTPVGFCYAKKEALTDTAWNMLAIAVNPDFQGNGTGSRLTERLESLVMHRGGRVLIAETSGVEDFHRTRAFYHKANYHVVGQIPDFWAESDDKIIFCKKLQNIEKVD